MVLKFCLHFSEVITHTWSLPVPRLQGEGARCFTAQLYAAEPRANANERHINHTVACTPPVNRPLFVVLRFWENCDKAMTADQTALIVRRTLRALKSGCRVLIHLSGPIGGRGAPSSVGTWVRGVVAADIEGFVHRPRRVAGGRCSRLLYESPKDIANERLRTLDAG